MTEKVEERIGVNEEAIETLKASDERQWQAIEKLQNRLPLWATMIISLLTFLLGCSFTYAGLIIRMG